MSIKAQLSSHAQQYLTVSQAAHVLSVHPSTVRRWIDQGWLPAYRLGEKRIGIKQTDLDGLVSPRWVPGEMEQPGVTAQRISVPPLSDREQRQMAAAVEGARRHQAELLAARGGTPLSDSADLIHEAREERTQDLTRTSGE